MKKCPQPSGLWIFLRKFFENHCLLYLTSVFFGYKNNYLLASFLIRQEKLPDQ